MRALPDAVARGIRMLLLREAAARTVALLGGLLLAALLGPASFGVVALALGLLAVTQGMSSLGLGATLLRRVEPPTESELRTLFTFQLLCGIAAAAVGLAVAFVVLPAFGASSAAVRATALVLFALPISAWRVAPACTLERELRYGAISAIDLAEQLIFYGVAILFAALGAGIWSISPAAIAGATAASVAAVAQTGHLPRLTVGLGSLRGLWRFGLGFQSTHLLSMSRDFGLNALLMAFAGAHTTGIWALAQRLLVPGMAIFQAFWRLGFVAFGKVRGRADATREANEILAVTSLVGGVLLASTVGAAPSLVALMGDDWSDVPLPLMIAALGWAAAGPVSASVLGLLQARGDLRVPALALGVQIAVLWGAAMVLAPSFGAAAVGSAWLVAVLIDGVIFLGSSRRYVTLSLPPLVLGFVIALVAGALGRVVSDSLTAVPGLVLSASTSLVVWALLARVLMPGDLRSVAALLGTGVRQERTRPAYPRTG